MASVFLYKDSLHIKWFAYLISKILKEVETCSMLNIVYFYIFSNIVSQLL